MIEWTHDRLQADLYGKRRRGKNTMAWSEVQIPGTNGGRFDVFTVRSHDARKSDTFIGYEVKATLADLESDLSSGKWRRYLPACDQFVFALGPALADDIDRIPEGPGVSLLVGEYGERWQVKRKPKGGHRDVSDTAIWKRLAVRDHWTPSVVHKTRLERMQDYEKMASLSMLISRRVQDEIAEKHADLWEKTREIEQIDRRRKQLEALEARLDGVPHLLDTLGLLLTQAGQRVGRPLGYMPPDEREHVARALDDLLKVSV